MTEIILEQYNLILAGESTQTIKEAQRVLLSLESSTNFLTVNADILHRLELTISVRKFATLYLSKYAKRIAKDKSKEKCQFAIQQFLAMLASPALQLEIRSLLINCLQPLLNAEFHREVRYEYVKQYSKLLNQSANKQDDQIDFAFIVFSGQAIFIKQSYSEEIKQIIKATILSLLKLTTKLISRAKQNFNILTNFTLIISIAKEYSVLLKQYFKRMALLDIQSMKILYLSQLQSLLQLVIHLEFPGNDSGFSLFMLSSNEPLSRIINTLKANFIAVLTNSIRLIFTFSKHPSLLATNPIYLKIPVFLVYFIDSTAGLLKKQPYYQLPSRQEILQTIDEVLNFFICCLRLHNFYQIFFENNSKLIQNIVFQCLALTPKDIDNFYQEGEEFLENTIQIVNRNIRIPANQINSNQPQEQQKQFETLRTLSAEFLNTFCKFQDGTLSHVVQFVSSILSEKQNGDKTLMLLIISILNHHFKQRRDLRTKVTQMIIELLGKWPIPVVNGNRKVQDLQYAYLLLALSKIFFYSLQQHPQILTQTFKLGVAIIQSGTVNEVHKYFVFELFNNLAKVEQAGKYSLDLLGIYNHLLKNIQQPTLYLLDAYSTLIKYNVDQLKRFPQNLIQAIQLICLHIQKEINRPQPTQIFIVKQWNIIRQVGQREQFIPCMVVPIQQAILPLLKYIDGIRPLYYDEDILMLLTAFIEKAKHVTLNQQKIFQIIPKLFYNQYYCRFGHTFHAIQLFIYYGSHILNSSPLAINTIVQMGITSITSLQYKKRPRNQVQNCQGALILQSLILKCASSFSQEIWTEIIKTIIKRLDQQIQFKLLSSKYFLFIQSLYGLLSLSLIHSYKYLSNEENQIIMAKILANMKVFNKNSYSSKVIIAGLTELLILSECDFIYRRFTYILDTVITLLEVTSVKRENYFDDNEPDEDKQYGNCIILLKNDLKDLDQFSYFRRQVEKLKIKNLEILQKSVNELPKKKKEFFTHILRIERVANEPRQIYRIKR